MDGIPANLAPEGTPPELLTRSVDITFRKFDEAELREIFSYHPPTPEQRETYEKINLAFILCAQTIVPLMPAGPGRTAAIRSLSDARMKANASVALEGKF